MRCIEILTATLRNSQATLININMRCIEIACGYATDPNYAEININMRCIEITQRQPTSGTCSD